MRSASFSTRSAAGFGPNSNRELWDFKGLRWSSRKNGKTLVRPQIVKRRAVGRLGDPAGAVHRASDWTPVSRRAIDRALQRAPFVRRPCPARLNGVARLTRLSASMPSSPAGPARPDRPTKNNIIRNSDFRNHLSSQRQMGRCQAAKAVGAGPGCDGNSWLPGRGVLSLLIAARKTMPQIGETREFIATDIASGVDVERSFGNAWRLPPGVRFR